MGRFRIRSVIVAASAVALASSPLAIQPASAIPANDSACTYVAPPGGITSAQISWSPGTPGAMSGLEVACVFRNDTGNSMVSPSYTIHDAAQAMWHNGAARTVTVSGTAASGQPTIQLSTGSNGIAGMPTGTINRIISGHAGLPAGAFVKTMTAGGLLTLNKNLTASVSGSLKIENASGARSVTDGVVTAASTTITSATANFDAGTDVGLSVSGTGIPAYTTIASVTNATTAVLSNAADLSGAAQTIDIGETLRTSTVRQITGATTTSATRINTAGGYGGFVASDLGLKVTGTCTTGGPIPANTYVTGTPSQQNLDTTGGLTAGWSGCTIVLGEPNANAPLNGEVVGSETAQLNLNPSLVPGSDACAKETLEGFSIPIKWYNPGSFQGTGITNTQPATTKAIAQLVIDTSAADFSAFVVERKTLTAGDPQPAVHYDVVWPFTPTNIGICPSTATSPGLGILFDFEGATASQTDGSVSAGRPGTGSVRNIEQDTGSGYTDTVFVDSQSATLFTPSTSFKRLCVFPAPPAPASYQCGAG